jgi:hypothetical protein
MTTIPFTPGVTSNLTVLTSSANIALPAGGETLRVAVVGTGPVYVKFGTSNAVTAATTDMPVFGSAPESFTVSRALLSQNGTTHVAAISAATGNTLYVTAGAGS